MIQIDRSCSIVSLFVLVKSASRHPVDFKIHDLSTPISSIITITIHTLFPTCLLDQSGYSTHLSRLGRHQKKQDIPYFEVQNALSLDGGILNLLVDAIGFAYSNTRESVGSFRISTQKVGGLQVGSLKSMTTC